MDGLGSVTSAVGGFDSFDTQGVHPVAGHCIGDDILGTKAKAGIRIKCSLGKTKRCPRPFGRMEILCLCPFEQIPAEVRHVLGFLI